MTSRGGALAGLPVGLREPLLAEYQSIAQNYLERRWSPSELSGGRFCEIVYTILRGHAAGTYPPKPEKPSDFVGACRKLETNTNVPRSFQILIPRVLPALYEIRNNRGVGHVGGDVDPNHMDAVAVLGMASWVMAELVRVFHDVDTGEAQSIVEQLAETKVPIVWEGSGVRRILDPKMSLKNQLLILVGTATGAVRVKDLFDWSEYPKEKYFLRVIRELHRERLIELDEARGTAVLLPPGAKGVERLVRNHLKN